MISIIAIVANNLRLEAERRSAMLDLRNKVNQIETLLASDNPVDGLILAIDVTGESQAKLNLTLSQVQHQLLSAIQTAKESYIFKDHEDSVYSVAFSPDGKYIASGSGDKTVRLWSRDGNSIGELFFSHEDRVSSVAFSPDGKYIASGSNDKAVRLWSRDGNLIGEPFIGHEARISSVAFSLDGEFIVSGSLDRTVRLWSRDGNPIGQPFFGHEDIVWSVAFSPDGKYIVSGSKDNTVRLWGGNWQAWLQTGCNRLQSHPALIEAETEVAKGAVETCFKYGWSKTEAAEFLVEQGQSLARKGKREEAVAKFTRANSLNPQLKLDPEEEAKKYK